MSAVQEAHTHAFIAVHQDVVSEDAPPNVPRVLFLSLPPPPPSSSAASLRTPKLLSSPYPIIISPSSPQLAMTEASATTGEDGRHAGLMDDGGCLWCGGRYGNVLRLRTWSEGFADGLAVDAHELEGPAAEAFAMGGRRELKVRFVQLRLAAHSCSF